MSGVPLNMFAYIYALITTFVKLLISKDSELRLKSADGADVITFLSQDQVSY